MDERRWELQFSLYHWINEKAMASHSSTLAWKIPWTEEPGRLQSMGSLSRTRLSDFTFTFHFRVLEKEMTAHSSVLAWRIPGTGDLGGLPSLGSHRVGHDWSDLAERRGDSSKWNLVWVIWVISGKQQYDQGRAVPCSGVYYNLLLLLEL